MYNLNTSTNLEKKHSQAFMGIYSQTVKLGAQPRCISSNTRPRNFAAINMSQRDLPKNTAQINTAKVNLKRRDISMQAVLTRSTIADEPKNMN